MVKPIIWDGLVKKSVRSIKYIVIHCQAGFGGWQSIENARKYNGWKTGGYHFYITLDGTIYQFYDLNQITNGVKGKNSNSIHVCYEGGVERKTLKALDTRTDSQKSSLNCLLQELRKTYTNAEILGHRDLSPDINGNGIIEKFEWVKECPSFNAKEEYKDI